MSWLTTLDHVTASQRQQFGGKAVSLARLVEIGYSVPRSLVISTEATCEFLRMAPVLPSSLFGEIAHKTQGWRRYAVRSSAVHEDGETRSWAGIFESCVDIPLDEVEDAIRQCLASLHSPASLKYAASQSLPLKDLAMAVILQEFVDGQVSGVGFSLDPVNHFANAMTIEATSAATAKAVDGKLIPDHYAIEKSTGRILDARKGQRKEYALSRAAVIGVANHIERLEREFGYPVDVEWTIQDGVFVPLQSRCVTTRQPPGTVATRAPQSYRFWWLDHEAWWQSEAGIRSFETETDVAANQLADVVYVREGGSTRCLISVEDVMRLTEIGFGLLSKEQFEHFEAESRTCLGKTHETLRALENIAGAHLTPEDIGAHLRAIDTVLGRCASLFRMCDPYATSAVFDSASQSIPADELIGLIAPSDPCRAQEAEDWSVLTGQAFDEGAAWRHVQKYPWLALNVYSRDAILITLRLKHRAPRDPGKRWAEACRKQFDGVGLPDTAREMLSILQGLSDLRLRLKLALTSFGFYFVELYQAIFAITGVSARELHERYSIPDMINLLFSHHLKPAEAPPAIGHFHGGKLIFVNAEHAGAFWQGRIVSLDHDADADDEIRGTVANRGQISGRVHLLRGNDPDKANRIRQRMHEGDILVSAMIQFDVMDLVQRAGGLITDEGGMLSHAAILAREVGIPCIVGTQRATRILKDGDSVTMNTTDGSVKRIDPAG